MKDKLTTLIAGPTDRTKVFRFSELNEEQYETHLIHLADTLIKNVSTANIIPDQGVPFDVSQKFRERGGVVIGYVPKGGYEGLKNNFQYCDEIKEFDGGWSALNTCLSLRGDLITTVGISPGTIVEVAYTKYHGRYMNKRIPVLIDEVLVPWKIPDFISEEIDIRYFGSVNQLNSILEKIREERK